MVFTGGGTGGHILPNLAIIDELSKIEPGLNVSYIGLENGLEEKLVIARGVHFYGIPAGKLRRYLSLENITDVGRTLMGVAQAWRILRRIRPQLVFAKGGFVSVPVVAAARMLKIPVWLHESDFSPGLSNKICARFADKIFLSFPESVHFFPGRVTSVVGNPIRTKILDGTRQRGFALTGFSPKKPVVLIMGGSTGATALNMLVASTLQSLLRKAQVVHITGPGKEGVSPRLLTRSQLAAYKSFSFLHDELADIYAIADVVVSRAGSGSIFEVLAWHRPFIAIPLPRSASRGDQIENARSCEAEGTAQVLDQDGLTPEHFVESVISLLEDEEARAKMIKAQKNMNVRESALTVAKAIHEFFKL